jgi:hypothetical protein
MMMVVGGCGAQITQVDETGTHVTVQGGDGAGTHVTVQGGDGAGTHVTVQGGGGAGVGAAGGRLITLVMVTVTCCFWSCFWSWSCFWPWQFCWFL